jgi:hypothetical protein
MSRNTYEAWLMLMCKVADGDLDEVVAKDMLDDYDSDRRKSKDEDRMIAQAEKQFYGRN